MVKQWLKYYKWRLLNPIIPCALCKVPSRFIICHHCQSELEINKPPYCNYCAKPGALICSSCREYPPAFNYTYCHYTYSTPLNKMLHQIKYKSDTNNIWALGYLLSITLSGIKTDTDFIIPIPLSAKRQQQRGFNQTEELLQFYQTTLNHIPVKTNIVKKIIDTPHQTSLSQSDRKNIPNAYVVEKNIIGKNILIVDDVITTGSTANNLAKALISAGAKRVELCVLLRSIQKAV